MNEALLQTALTHSVLLPVVVRGRRERMQRDHAAVYLHISHQAFLPVTRSQLHPFLLLKCSRLSKTEGSL